MNRVAPGTPLHPWHTRLPRAVSGECWTERCSPWPAPFSPQAPPKIALLCSSGSSIVWRGPTPPERARLPCGLRLRGPASFTFGLRRSRGLPVLVHVVSQRARVLRLRRTDCSLALSQNSRVAFLYSGESRRPDVPFFEAQSPGPPIPLSTLQASSRDVACKTEGQDGVAGSFPVRLFHSLQHAGLTRRSLRNGALSECGC